MSRRAFELALATLAVLVVAPSAARAQAGAPTASHGATVMGRVLDASNNTPIAGVRVSIEGRPIESVSDSAGRYRLLDVPAGPQILQTRRVGFALARVAIVVTSTGTVARDIELARVALQMREVRVSADPVSRARGELGTATVVTREAIANLGTPSVAGVLELLPGIPLQAPGLDGSLATLGMTEELRSG